MNNFILLVFNLILDMEQIEHFRRSRDHYVDSPNNTVRIVGSKLFSVY